ncbi:MAG: flagellar assembly protein T N-terminal domain-containing protein [Pseudomonadota bacterium]
MKKNIHLYILFFVASLFSTSIVATTIEVQGHAIINDSITQARSNAYQDALRQAALSAGVQVSSLSSIAVDGQITDSLQIRSSQFIESSEIINEKIKDNILTLTIRAELNSYGTSCNFPAAQYRKKIAATFIPMIHPEHLGVIDFYDFDKAISTEILKRLSRTGNFLTREANDISLYEDPNQAPFISKTSISNDTLLSQIADNRDVQYVISGVIRDLSYELESERLKQAPFFPSFTTFWGNQRKANKRNLLIDFFLHDTLTGELLSKTSYSHSVTNTDVLPERAIAFGTKAFFDTSYGQLFSRVLNQEVANIQRILSCRPFTMRIIDQKQGKIYLNAGLSNKVKAGDILTVYFPDKPGEVFGVKGTVNQFGQPKTSIKIDKVYPAYSTAIPESGSISYQDIINGFLIAW